ncbi:MAG: hypothetical protein GTN38_03505 [Candidatus Aenigmarchaeota archaeon]|nr:hypothetical protein [Candidatus Aenigmarchaeota archaeon]NIP40727.1 hypothetical protein [Candidatus Aenigmarchaeota archaeon]NIS73432.1 hypothetical protein [Candidatus Aenigmarchaeota archaeon]
MKRSKNNKIKTKTGKTPIMYESDFITKKEKRTLIIQTATAVILAVTAVVYAGGVFVQYNTFQNQLDLDNPHFVISFDPNQACRDSINELDSPWIRISLKNYGKYPASIKFSPLVEGISFDGGEEVSYVITEDSIMENSIRLRPNLSTQNFTVSLMYDCTPIPVSYYRFPFWTTRDAPCNFWTDCGIRCEYERKYGYNHWERVGDIEGLRWYNGKCKRLVL